MSAKQRVFGFDFIRAVSALIIIIFHFAGQVEVYDGWKSMGFLLSFANGMWGDVAVSMFFMLSGASLVYSYGAIKKGQLLKFYKKRWLSIFPAFYTIWLGMYLHQVWVSRNFFYSGKKPLILTLIGMDGYFNYRTVTYNFVGEWFVGAIVLIYILYPVLGILFEKKILRLITTIALVVGEVLVLSTNLFLIPPFRNLITCLMAFWMGMLFVAYRDLLMKPYVVGVSIVVILLLMLIKFSVNSVFATVVFAFACFEALMAISSNLEGKEAMKRCTSFVANISYEIFLLQHLIIFWLLGYFEAYKIGLGQEILLLILDIAITIACGYVLHLVQKRILRTKK